MTFSRLTLGEPRLKGRPKGSIPCEDTTVKTSATDGGFEAFGADTGHASYPFLPYEGGEGAGHGTWPVTDKAGNALFAPVDGGYEFANEVADVTLTPPPYTEGWYVASTDPHSGTYHIEQDLSSGGGSSQGFRVFFYANRTCAPKTSGPSVARRLFTSRVSGGQIFEFGFWAKYVNVNNPSNTAISVSSVVDFRAEDWSVLNISPFSFNTSATITTSYQHITVSGVVPANAYYCYAYAVHERGGSSLYNNIYRYDDFHWSLV